MSEESSENIQKKQTERSSIIKCMGVSENSGTPKSSHFNRVFHYKPSILGFPYFWKHPYLIQNGLPLWTGDTGRSFCSCHFQLHPCRVHPEDGLERWNERNSRHQAPNTASTILGPDFFLKSVKPKKNQIPPLLAGVSNDKKRTPKRFDSSSNLIKLDPILDRTHLTQPNPSIPPIGMDFLSTLCYQSYMSKAEGQCSGAKTWD